MKLIITQKCVEIINLNFDFENFAFQNKMFLHNLFIFTCSRIYNFCRLKINK